MHNSTNTCERITALQSLMKNCIFTLVPETGERAVKHNLELLGRLAR